MNKTHISTEDLIKYLSGVFEMELNIYEYERRMNIIITNTEEILSRLDEILNNQYELATGLQQANNRINMLCSGVNTFMLKLFKTAICNF